VTIAIVAYGMGNIRSIVNALDHLGHASLVATEPKQLAQAAKIIIPGVGAFRMAMERLAATGFQATLDEEVRAKKKPVLGVCLGMQVLADTGTEGGDSPGLGWVPGRVEIIPRGDTNLRLPHVGWNEIAVVKDCPVLKDLGPDRAFYFVHSYHLKTTDDADVCATTDYGGPITAAVARGHVFGFQPHPEKSQQAGLKVLDNFARL
jgi:glutamine amidotransferase